MTMNMPQIEEKKQAAADVLYQYSKFAMACIGNRVRPCDLRLHLMKVLGIIFSFNLAVHWIQNGPFLVDLDISC